MHTITDALASMPDYVPEILIVDDSPENLEILAGILSSYPVSISFALNGAEALTGIAEQPPDLILLDVMMPVMDGFEVCQRLQAEAETSSIPVIILSARNNSDDAVTGLQAGAVDYVTKPFNKIELLTRIAVHLELKFAREKLARQNVELQQLSQKLHEQAVRDPLTGLYNRRYLYASLPQKIRSIQRVDGQLAALLIDIDHFKQVNDSYGHDAGDRMLQVLADFLDKQIRGEDIACRYGGEEFLILMLNVDQTTALQRAEEMRQGVQQLAVKYNDTTIQITLSIGVAVSPAPLIDIDALLQQADKAVYRAKDRGRNQVVLNDA